MKKFILILLLLVQSSSFAADIKLSEVKKKLLDQNLELQATAQQVYQSKLQIRLARANLLPRLNIAKLASTAWNITGAIGLIEDIAPFLFPSNWFKVRETRFLAQASDLSFDALKMNQIYSGRTSAMSVLADQIVLDEINGQVEAIKGWIGHIQIQEKLGQLPYGTSSDFERLLLEAQRDSFIQTQGVQTELSELKYLFNVPQNESLKIIGSLDETSDIPVTVEPKWAENTPETMSFDNLIQASREYRKGYAFSFLGSTSNAVGMQGGVFDSLPAPNGLGFGIGPAMKIGRAQTEILSIQRLGSIQTQEKALAQAFSMIESQNLILSNVASRNQKIENSLGQLESSLRLGLKLDANRLFELLRDRLVNRVETTICKLNLAFAVDRKHRILNQVDYKLEEPSEEQMR